MTAYDTSIRVSLATKAADAGVVISVSGDRYVIWAFGTDGRITEQSLEVSCTDEDRLTAHVLGFIANHKKAWAVGALLVRAEDCQRAHDRLKHLADLEENPLVRDEITKGATNMLIKRVEWLLAARRAEQQNPE